MLALVGLACVTPVVSFASESGCGKSSHPRSGKHSFNNQGKSRDYYINVPTGYSSSSRWPVVVLFHGWGLSGKEWYSGSGYGTHSATPASNAHGFILVAPTGLTDSSLPGNCDNGGGYCSWNAGGTTGSPGPQGPTCNLNIQKDDYCYRDTCKGGCKDRCSWSTCNDDTTMVHDLLDKIESEFCVDLSRVYAGGESNGGMMTWQMGTDSRASRFAAFVPVIGLPHHGFSYLPSILPFPIMGIWGSRDKTIPHGNNRDEYTQSQDGWYYTAARYITKSWADVHGCDVTSDPLPYSTNHDGSNGLSCTSFSKDCHHGDAPVVDCRFQGGHIVPSYTPELMWEFFSKHTRLIEGYTIPPLPKNGTGLLLLNATL